MIDWNKRNGGFLSPESVYEDQLSNLSMQINQKDKEIEKLNTEIDYLHQLRDEDAEELKKKDNIINVLSKNVDMWNRKYNKQFNIIYELEKWLEENDKQLCLRKLRELEEGISDE